MTIFHFTGLQEPTSAGDDSEEPDPRILKVIRFMEEHCGVPVRIETLAAQACLSPGRFSHLFRVQTGTSPMRMLARVRIDRARFLLETTRLPVKGIAGEAGFASTITLQRAFGALCGMTPGEYRRNATAGRDTWIPARYMRAAGAAAGA